MMSNLIIATQCGVWLFFMNKDLGKLLKEDQADRIAGGVNGDFSAFKKKDANRKKIVKQMLSNGVVVTGKDLYAAAMIFHHGQSLSDYKTAIKLSEQSIEKGYQKAPWLYAAATDRLLLKQGKKQKFGTQFFKKSPKSKWELSPIEKMTTDEERARFSVPPLAKLKEQINTMNKNK